ncbi:acyl-CoA dehydrogenase [Algoriphagus lutimaris]|uniref:acyl-CoA dehydrogenase n=1 Tax=Algoriphagus lutimaris TaxID=613197 RepID=UPI00196AFD7E|nr:acyl-CoA dehydrogenase [Algoriphagus lutimaris]MBN3519844.1 acyl-CoA dehydrogenase [Algoriphagus lutimaris]
MKDTKLFNHELAIKAEKLGSLPDEWLELIYQEKWFKMFVPVELGGLAYSFPEALQIEERLARLDGSLGWTITLCAGAGWFVGFMNEQLRNSVFPASNLCLAGSGFVGGKADFVNGEYEISGSWTYASGALHATNFTANCEILENGKPLMDEEGNPLVKAFLLEKNEVEILDGWNYMGMIATGSHAFKAEKIKVPAYRAFEIKPDKTTLKDSIYKFPFLQFAEATLAVNVLGVSQHLIDLIEESFWKRHYYRKYDQKHLSYFQKILEKKKKKLDKFRNEFYEEVDKSWDELGIHGKISKKNLKSLSKSARKLSHKCREYHAVLYPFSGLEAAKTHTELNRVWRDFNTVSQHALLIFPF